MQPRLGRLTLVLGLLLGTTASGAKPTLPRLRDRAIVDVLPTRSRPRFAALGQEGWRATWDRDTGIPARLWGGHVDVPGAIRDAGVAERAARQFLAAHLDLLAPGALLADFALAANRLDDGTRTIGFTQTWHDLPVIGGQIGFVFQADRMFAVGSSAWPRVTASTSPNATAILPLVRAGVIEYHAVSIEEVDPQWRVYRDARGREVARESRRLTASATLTYNASVRHPGGARADYPVPAADITVDGIATTTAVDGGFTWPGSATATVEPSLVGTYVRVINGAGTPATITLTAQPDDVVNWSLASDELGDAQLSTYIYANIAKARARTINPSLGPWLDTRLDFFVNENGACNAFSTGDAVHLFRGTASCANTGRLADIVFHEFGHAMHFNSLIAGMGAADSSLSEGLADFFAANLTGDSAMGRGFFLDDAPLREIDPIGSERVYPLDLDFDTHVSGLIIGGALWDLRKALIKSLGSAAGIARAEKVLTGIMQRADDIGTTFVAALIADDDDGDLSNNTPNYCALERAFGSHGLVPGYVPTRVSPPHVEDLELTMTVDTPNTSMCAPPAVVSISVTWRAGDGVPSTFELVPDGATWRGAFPPQPDATVLSYWIDVVYDDGNLQVFPNNPADPYYQLFVGSAVPLYCESFNTDPAWPQASNMGFEWQWGVPVVGAAGDDPTAAFTGVNVLGTDLSSDGKYRPNLVVSTTMPVVRSAHYEQVRLQYRRWLTVEDGVSDRATIRANGMEIWRNAKSVSGTLDHIDREWRFQDLDVTPYVSDGSVELEWALSTDFSKELGGWTIDDVCVVGIARIPRCGDGVLDDREQCDDGNTTDSDGCNHACIDEVTAGGGGCCGAGTAAPQNVGLAGLLLLGWRRRTRRRRGSRG